MTLTLDDTAKLGKMLAEYEEAARSQSLTTSIPTRYFIADDIVSQALDDLLHDWLAMREIVQEVADPHTNMSDIPELVTKARALLASEEEQP